MMTQLPQIATLKDPSKSFFYVLDIDSTLLNTHHRNQAIVKKFSELQKHRHPEDCAGLALLDCQLGDYGYYTALERSGFKAKHPDFLKEFDSYWREQFFSNNFLHHDTPTPGALPWVQNLKTFDIDFVYLTARHKQHMWDGTIESMTNMGFPIKEDVLFLKENLKDSDENYKVSILGELLKDRKQEEIVFIDNEPVVLHRILEEYPKVQLVWFDSTHSGKMEPPEQALRIDSFTF